MQTFEYRRATDVTDAVAAGSSGARYIAGGTNLVDLMRQGVETPTALVDVSRLSRTIERLDDGSLRVGAGMTNSELASSAVVRQSFPMVSAAVLNGASAQIRNTATVAGNILQRTRCPYFYDLATRCNKRAPGTGCDATGGQHHGMAVLGTSPHCIAVHPSDLAVALAAHGARVELAGHHGSRTVELTELHRLPGSTPHLETVLDPGELITAVTVPSLPPGTRSTYRKVRERASYAFALVSVAAAVEVRDGTVRTARLALGGVAPKPWRVPAAEQALIGAPPSVEAFTAAAEHLLADADPLPQNAYKVDLARRVVVATLSSITDQDA